MRVMFAHVHTNGDGTLDCDYVILDIDNMRSEIKRLSRRAKGLNDVSIYSSAHVVLAYETAERILGVEVLDGLDSTEPVIIDITDEQFTEMMSHDESTECNILRVSSDAFHYEFYPKHTDLLCETQQCQISKLERPKKQKRKKAK